MSSVNDPLPTNPLDHIAEGVNPPVTTSADRSADTVSRVVAGAHDAIDHLAHEAAPHLQRVQDGLASANEMLHQRGEQARELGHEWSEGVNRTVRDHPLAAIATAFVLGMLVVRLAR